MKSQLEAYEVRSAAVFGVAGGNGLEYVDPEKYRIIYGIDVSREYLEACGKRFKSLGGGLVLIQADLSDETCVLPKTELVIANLFIEYIGISIFIKHLSKALPVFVSCVIQKNGDAGFVSDSPYMNSLEGISRLHRDIEKDKLIDSMNAVGYSLVLSQEYPLPGGKKLLRLDFKK